MIARASFQIIGSLERDPRVKRFIMFAAQRFFSASTVDELHQFRPDSWVPTETAIVHRDRVQRTFVSLEQFALQVKREEDGRKNISVSQANCTGNER